MLLPFIPKHWKCSSPFPSCSLQASDTSFSWWTGKAEFYSLGKRVGGWPGPLQNVSQVSLLSTISSLRGNIWRKWPLNSSSPLNLPSDRDDVGPWFGPIPCPPVYESVPLLAVIQEWWKGNGVFQGLCAVTLNLQHANLKPKRTAISELSSQTQGPEDWHCPSGKMGGSEKST